MGLQHRSNNYKLHVISIQCWVLIIINIKNNNNWCSKNKTKQIKGWKHTSHKTIYTKTKPKNWTNKTPTEQNTTHSGPNLPRKSEHLQTSQFWKSLTLFSDKRNHYIDFMLVWSVFLKGWFIMADNKRNFGWN